MRDHTAQLKLEDDFLPRLRDKFCCAVKVGSTAGLARGHVGEMMMS